MSYQCGKPGVSLSVSSTRKSSALASLGNVSPNLLIRETALGPNKAKQDKHLTTRNSSFHNHTAESQMTKCFLAQNYPDFLGELIQYPPDIIQTIVEKHAAGDLSIRNDSKVTATFSKTNSFSKARRKSKRHRDKRTSSSSVDGYERHVEYPGSTTSQISVLNQDCESVKSLESDVGTILFLSSRDISTQSEPVIVENKSTQIFVETDCFQHNYLDLKRENANLLGQLESITAVVTDISNERAQLQSKLHLTEKALRTKEDQLSEVQDSDKRLKKALKELQKNSYQSESTVTEYQEVIEAKIEEINYLKENIRKLKTENETFQIKVVDVEEQNKRLDRISNILKDDLQKTSSELKSVILAKVHLDEEKGFLYKEVMAKAAQIDRLQFEMNNLRVKLAETQKNMITLQEELIAGKQALKCYAKEPNLKKQTEPISEMRSNTAEFGEEILNDSSPDIELAYENLSNEREKLSEELKRSKLSLETARNDIEKLKMAIEEGNSRFKSVQSELKRFVESSKVLKDQKIKNEQQLALLESENKQLRTQIARHEDELRKLETDLLITRNDLITRSSQLDSCQKTFLKLEESVAFKDCEISDLKNTIKTKETGVVQKESYFEMQCKLKELTSVIESLEQSAKLAQINFETEKQELKNNLNENDVTIQKLKIGIETISKELCSIKRKSDNQRHQESQVLEREISAEPISSAINSDLDLRNRNRQIASNLSVILKRYRSLKQTKESLENQLNFVMSSKPRELFKREIDCQTDFLDSTDSILTKLNDAIQLNDNFRLAIKQKELQLEEMEALIVQLEHDRGKFISTAKSANDEELCSIRDQFNNKCLELNELKKVNEEKLLHHRKEMITLNKRIEQLEGELEREISLRKDTKRNLLLEKRNSSKLKCDFFSIQKSMQESNQIADKRLSQLNDFEKRFSSLLENERILKQDKEQLEAELQKVKSECNAVRQQVQQSDRNNFSLSQELTNVSLSLREKGHQLKSLQLELDTDQERLEKYQSEMDLLKKQLFVLKKDKFVAQLKANKLQVALKSRDFSPANLIENGRKDETDLGNLSPSLSASSSSCDPLGSISDIYSDGRQSLYELFSSVESLKAEMDSLQDHIRQYNLDS